MPDFRHRTGIEPIPEQKFKVDYLVKNDQKIFPKKCKIFNIPKCFLDHGKHFGILDFLHFFFWVILDLVIFGPIFSQKKIQKILYPKMFPVVENM